MAIALTTGLGKFISELRYRDIPQEALLFIRMGFTDCMACLIAGSCEPAPQLLKKMLAATGNESMVLLGEGRASAPEAAWINGTAAHALDFDDIALGCHPSAVLVPAILAEAEVLDASGEQMALAYAAGYETMAELARRDADQHHKKGWHPTAVFGAIGAAAACASLHQLSATQAAMAIAISASQSAGLVANFGSMTKPFQVGRANHAGVVSARLAKIEYTGAMDALENSLGLLAAISPDGKIDVESALQAGKDWKLPRKRLAIKKYPSCGFMHRALDGMLDLLDVNPLEPEKVSRISVSTSRRGVMVLSNHAPQTGLAAKFSMEFGMACALIARRVGLSEFADDFVRRPDVQQLMKRVVVIPEDRQDAAGYAIYDQVTVETVDGRSFDSGHITQVRGGPDSPLNRDELWQKFEGCVQVSGKSLPARALFDATMAIDKLPHARDLQDLAIT